MRGEAVVALDGIDPGDVVESRGWRSFFRSVWWRTASTPTGRIGLATLVLILALAWVGPLVAPHSISDIVGKPFQGPSAAAPLGTDFLGRDVLSRVLHGGRVLPAVALGTVLVAYAIGCTVGLFIGLRRGLGDTTAVWAIDTVLSIPPIIASLLLLAGLGTGVGVVALAIAGVLVAPIARIVRAATIEVAANEYVEAAVARGESTRAIMLREILPNLRGTIVADFGIRVAYATAIYASLSFLGLGPEPPTADWGLMISENRPGLLILPWAVLVPAGLIALLIVSITFIADALARSVGRSVLGR